MSSEIDQRFVDVWLEAARDLGIRIRAPHEIRAPGGKRVLCEVFLPDFGSANGAIIVTAKSERRLRSTLRAGGYWVAVHPDRGARTYNRNMFRDELEDIRWFGPETEKPSWYRDFR